MDRPIRMQEALALINQKDALGKPIPFQISFFTSSPKLSGFKRVSLPAAVRTGLPIQHRSSKRLIGIRPIVRSQHLYSVHQGLITEINHQPVIP